MDFEEYAVLKAEINSQIDEINGIFKKIDERKSITGLSALESLSYQLHNLYCAFEDLFKIVAKTFENHISDKSGYHIELLKRMSISVEGIRPPLLSKATYTLLDNLRGFRHFFRHAYNYELDKRKVNLVVEDAEKLRKIYFKDIEKFLRSLSPDV